MFHQVFGVLGAQVSKFEKDTIGSFVWVSLVWDLGMTKPDAVVKKVLQGL